MQRRILIADALPAQRVIFQARLGEGFFRPFLAADAASCLRAARRDHPDLIVLDCDLPDMSGPQVITALRSDPRTRSLPVIALVAPGQVQKRLAAFRAGADDVMPRPPDMAVLLARIRNLLRQREETQVMARAWGGERPAMLGLAEQQQNFQPTGPVGLIATQPEIALKWKQRLAPRLREQARSFTPTEVIGPNRDEKELQSHVLLIEAGQGGSDNGLRLMTQLASTPPFRRSMFCIIAPDCADIAAMAFDLGAHDVIPPSVCPDELDLRLRLLLRRKQQADCERSSIEAGLRLAIIDPLTGAYNRRYAFPRLAGIAEQAALEGTEFAVLLLDLDRFKAINDRYGHAAGDRVLVEVVRRLRDNLRIDDLVARIGGEEFLVALPDTSPTDAAHIAERLRKAVSATPIACGSGPGPGLKVTVSIGMQTGGGPGRHPADITGMVGEADGALLRAKTAGRNTVTLCHSPA